MRLCCSGKQSATTGKTGGMRNAPERGRIEQYLVFIDRINRIFWIFYFSQSPDETEKAQSRPRAGKGNLAYNPCASLS